MKKISFFILVVMLLSTFALVSAKGEGTTEAKGKDNSSEAMKHKMENNKGMEKKKKEKVEFDREQKEGTEAVCPVAKEKFKITKETLYSKYKDKYYYFCCDACKPVFEKDPEKYIE